MCSCYWKFVQNMVSQCYTLGIYSLTKKGPSNPSCIKTHHMHQVRGLHRVTWDSVHINKFHISNELKPSFTYIITYLLTPCSTVLNEKLTTTQLVKKFPTLYETRRFITAVTSAHHLSLSLARSIQPFKQVQYQLTAQCPISQAETCGRINY
jgi:hypothetical protein